MHRWAAAQSMAEAPGMRWQSPRGRVAARVLHVKCSRRLSRLTPGVGAFPGALIGCALDRTCDGPLSARTRHLPLAVGETLRKTISRASEVRLFFMMTSLCHVPARSPSRSGQTRLVTVVAAMSFRVRRQTQSNCPGQISMETRSFGERLVLRLATGEGSSGHATRHPAGIHHSRLRVVNAVSAIQSAHLAHVGRDRI